MLINNATYEPSVKLKEKIKMHISGNKKISAIIVVVLLMSSAFALFANTPAEAQLAAQQPSVAIPSGATANITALTIATP